jgi:transmembrane sensor
MPAAGDDPLRDGGLREESAAWLARLRGPSTPEDHAAFEAWYNAAPEHAEAYDAVLQSWEAAGLAKLTPAGRTRRDLKAGLAYRWRYAVAAAAAVMVIALFAFGAGARFLAPDAARPVEFASHKNEIRTIELADGSGVTLDTASLVRATYSPRERRVVLLRGRARFAVAHDSARPFIVATPAGSVIAHGTVFDVAFDGMRIMVSLIEGSIEIRPANATSKAEVSQMLTAGQSVIVDGGKIETASRPSQADTNWPTGMLSFENAPLGEVVAAANRYSARGITLADPMLARLRFTGTFRATDTEQLARLVAAMFELELSQDDRGAFVLSPRRAAADGDRRKNPG